MPIDARAGDIVRTLRTRSEITSGELAEMLFVDRTTVEAIESGRMNLPESSVRPMARVFGLEPRDLEAMLVEAIQRRAA